MVPPPPGLLTTTSGVGTSLVAASVRSIVRAVLSLLPPGPEAATISTFFCGTHPCANGAPAATARTTLTSVVTTFGFTALPCAMLRLAQDDTDSVSVQCSPIT